MGLVLYRLFDAAPHPRSASSDRASFRRRVLSPPRSLSDRGAIFVRLRSLQLPRRRDRAMSFRVLAGSPSQRQSASTRSIYPLSHVRVLTGDEIAAGGAYREDAHGLQPEAPAALTAQT